MQKQFRKISRPLGRQTHPYVAKVCVRVVAIELCRVDEAPDGSRPLHPIIHSFAFYSHRPRMTPAISVAPSKEPGSTSMSAQQDGSCLLVHAPQVHGALAQPLNLTRPQQPDALTSRCRPPASERRARGLPGGQLALLQAAVVSIGRTNSCESRHRVSVPLGVPRFR